jgi:hypothetical protein
VHISRWLSLKSPQAAAIPVNSHYPLLGWVENHGRPNQPFPGWLNNVVTFQVSAPQEVDDDSSAVESLAVQKHKPQRLIREIALSSTSFRMPSPVRHSGDL